MMRVLQLARNSPDTWVYEQLTMRKTLLVTHRGIFIIIFMLFILKKSAELCPPSALRILKSNFGYLRLPGHNPEISLCAFNSHCTIECTAELKDSKVQLPLPGLPSLTRKKGGKKSLVSPIPHAFSWAESAETQDTVSHHGHVNNINCDDEYLYITVQQKSSQSYLHRRWKEKVVPCLKRTQKVQS